MNMTANAILGNLETVECTCSWKGDDSKEKVLNFEDHFQKVWNGDCEGVRVFEAKNNFSKRKMILSSLSEKKKTQM